MGVLPSRRKRIGTLLSDADRNQALIMENTIISELRHPPAHHPHLHISPEVTKWYLAKFEPQSEPITTTTDFWFRYGSPKHVSAWGQFLNQRLMSCVERVESSC